MLNCRFSLNYDLSSDTKFWRWWALLGWGTFLLCMALLLIQLRLFSSSLYKPFKLISWIICVNIISWIICHVWKDKLEEVKQCILSQYEFQELYSFCFIVTFVYNAYQIFRDVHESVLKGGSAQECSSQRCFAHVTDRVMSAQNMDVWSEFHPL